MMKNKVIVILVMLQISLNLIGFSASENTVFIQDNTIHTAGILGTNSLNNIIWSGTEFIIAGNDGKIYTSTDGNTWSSNTVGTNSLSEIAFSGSQYVAVGNYGTMLKSTNLSSWENISGPTNNINSVAWGVNKFIAVGDYGTILMSGTTSWEWGSAPISDNINSIIWSGNEFVIVGDYGNIATSTDGYSWSQASTGYSTNLYDVAYNGSIYVAVGASGTILTSEDGMMWSMLTPTTNTLYGIEWGEGGFVAVGESGTVLSSSDGISWAQGSSDVTDNLNSVVYGNGNYVIVGDNGLVKFYDMADCTLKDPYIEDTNRYIINEISIIDTYAYVNVKNNASDSESTLIIVSYDINNRLKGINLQQLNLNKGQANLFPSNITLPEGGYIKAFVWSDMINANPLSNIKTYSTYVGLTFLQNGQQYNITNNTQELILNKDSFNIRFHFKKSYFIQIACLTDINEYNKIQVGVDLNYIYDTVLSFGKGMAGSMDKPYNPMYISNFGHHVVYYEDENNRRLDLIENKGNDLLLVEWPVNRVKKDGELEYAVSQMPYNELYFVMYYDHNSDRIIDADELFKVKLLFD